MAGCLSTYVLVSRPAVSWATARVSAGLQAADHVGPKIVGRPGWIPAFRSSMLASSRGDHGSGPANAVSHATVRFASRRRGGQLQATCRRRMCIPGAQPDRLCHAARALPGGQLAAWLTVWTWIAGSFLATTLLFLLFPTGRS